MIHKILNFIWNNLLALLGIIGTLYFYFENRKFKKYNAEKDLKIAEADLNKFDKDYRRKRDELEKIDRAKIRNNGFVRVDERTIQEKEKYFEDWKKDDEDFWNERSKKEAIVSFNKKIKNHSIFWFLKRKQNDDHFLMFKESKLKKFIKKLKSLVC